MTRPPRVALAGVRPFRVDAAGAAYLVGERSVDSFRASVAAGIYPPGKKVGARLLWLVRELERAVDPDAIDPAAGAAHSQRHPASLDALIDRKLGDDRDPPQGHQTRHG